jgi:hypothetical protein
MTCYSRATWTEPPFRIFLYCICSAGKLQKERLASPTAPKVGPRQVIPRQSNAGRSFSFLLLGLGSTLLTEISGVLPVSLILRLVLYRSCLQVRALNGQEFPKAPNIKQCQLSQPF